MTSASTPGARSGWWTAGPAGLILVVATALVIAVADAGLREPIFGGCLLALDALGVFFSLRAARHGARVIWRFAAAGRALSLTMTIAFATHALTGSTVSWWCGALSGLAMFACLSAAALSASVGQVRGRQRLAFGAEVLTVLSCAFMLVWHLVLRSAVQTPASYHWVFEVGFALGNLLLGVVICAVLLRGAGRSLREPVTMLLAGMMLYAVSDTVFSSIRVHGGDPADSPVAVLLLVTAELVMTVAAMLMNPRARGDAGVRWSAPPVWSVYIPYAGAAAGNGLLLVIAIDDRQFSSWGGLVLAQCAMTGALILRQLVWLRDGRDASTTDPLTGLANLAGLRRGLRRAAARGGRIAFLVIDLDDFKPVNDRYGHETGNLLLVHVAHTLQANTRARRDIAARVGGDEFVVVLTGVEDDAQAGAVAERLLASFRANPVEAGGGTITVHASIGVATAGAAEDMRDVQHRADLAMYEAKRAQKDSWRAYDPTMTDRRTRDSVLADLLADALERDELEVHYQPIVDLGTGRVLGVEALARWEHPEVGVVSPVEFIPIAERNGLIDRIGLWVLARAAGQVAGWQRRQHTDPLHLSVNLSPRQLRSPALVADIRRTLAGTGLAPGFLTLEITESAIVDASTAAPVLAELRGHGIRIAVDDFGTGYSSLQYLTDLPIDSLKIDRTFTGQLDSTSRGAAVAQAVIRLGQILDLEIVAEGVETPAQVAELLVLGCATGQGYLFSRPLPAGELESVLHLEPVGVS